MWPVSRDELSAGGCPVFAVCFTRLNTGDRNDTKSEYHYMNGIEGERKLSVRKSSEGKYTKFEKKPVVGVLFDIIISVFTAG